MINPLQNSTSELLHQSSGLSIAEFIKVLVDKYPGQVTFSSSFSFEDQVITHEILHNNLDVKIFTLDTGRLFAETYSVWNSTNEKYNTHIKAYYPQAEIHLLAPEEIAPLFQHLPWLTRVWPMPRHTARQSSISAVARG